MKKIFSNLTFWVLLSITAGILLGHFYPKIALAPVLDSPIKFSLPLTDFESKTTISEYLIKLILPDIEIKTTFSEFLSSIFISTVKIFINPIIFLTIILGIISMGDLKKVGKVGAKALIYFEIVTTFALIIGIFAANIIRPGDGVSTAAVDTKGDISKYTQKAQDYDLWQFFKDNSTLQILLLAIVLGIIFNYFKNRQAIVDFLTPISKKVFWALHKVMLLAPIGAFGGMAFTIGKYGIATLLPLAKLMATVYCTMAIFIFVVLNLILEVL